MNSEDNLKELEMIPVEEEKYKRAKKRIEELKGFYVHLAIYVVINTFLLVNIYIRSLGEPGDFWEFSHFFTLIFWGIGLAFHAAHTFKLNPLFGKKWEERQIRKYMDKDKEASEKYQ